MSDPSSINDQIKDSIEQIQKMLSDDDGHNVRMFSYQLMAHAVGLAMYNTVHQQQQMYTLQNAITTAAAKAILEGSPEQALKLAKEGFASHDLTETLSQLKKFMDDLNETYRDLQQNPGSPEAEAPRKKAAAKKRASAGKGA